MRMTALRAHLPSRRIILSVLAGVTVLGVLVAAYLFRPIEHPSPPTLAAAGGNLTEGAYLAQIGNCAACHTRPGGAPFAGGVKFKTDFGTLFSTNITPDRAQGIGAWDFADFYRAMKYGEGHDGENLYPAFPYTHFANMADADIASLFLFIQSVPASSQANTANAMAFPFGYRVLMTPWKRMFGAPVIYEKVASAQEQRGRYLADAVAHCGACHTPRNALGGPDTSRVLQGGAYYDQVANGQYRLWSAPDITHGPHGLSKWTKADMADYLLHGLNRHAVAHGPMADVFESTRHLRSDDADAIASYLIGEKKGAGRWDFSYLRSGVEAGKVIYTVHCGTCHLPDGKGDRILGVSLRQNPLVQAENPASLINVILYGPQLPKPPFAANRTKMKPFGKRLSDEDIAALATYLRSEFGNNAPAVDEDDVKRQR